MLTNLVGYFPALLTEGYKRTSLPTPAYNCIAHAAGVDTHRWEPDSFGVLYWPPGVSRVSTLANWQAAFAMLGYTVCVNSDVEPGQEKIAIYAVSGKPTHVARQLPDGKWSSKCGDLDDISHALLAFENSSYGSPVLFMSRATPASPTSSP